MNGNDNVKPCHACSHNWHLGTMSRRMLRLLILVRALNLSVDQGKEHQVILGMTLAACVCQGLHKSIADVLARGREKLT